MVIKHGSYFKQKYTGAEKSKGLILYIMVYGALTLLQPLWPEVMVMCDNKHCNCIEPLVSPSVSLLKLNWKCVYTVYTVCSCCKTHVIFCVSVH